MTVEEPCRDFLRKLYSEQLFLPPVSSLVRKPFRFVNSYIHEKTSYLQYMDVSFKKMSTSCLHGLKKSFFLFL